MTTDLSGYIGATIDVLAFRGAELSGSVLLDQSIADENTTGEICTGIQKLAQRFTLELLTETGTIAGNEDRGTDLMTKLRQGYIHSEADLQASFMLAEQQARSNLRSEELETDPDDERYKHAELTALEITATQAKLYIALTSKASTVTFVMPVSILV